MTNAASSSSPMMLLALLLLALLLPSGVVECQRRRQERPTTTTTRIPPDVMEIGPEDGIVVFPTHRPLTRPHRLTTTPQPPPPPQAANQIPVSLFLNKSVHSVEDFMKNWVVEEPEIRGAGIGLPSRSNPNLLSRTNVVVRSGELAKLASCDPQPSVVEIDKPSDPAFIYFPPCTNVPRCGGCCLHDLLTCVATNVESVDVRVMKLRFTPAANKFVPVGQETIALEVHESCECQCRVKAEDCNAMQVYRQEECRCICTNEHEANDCVGHNKFWDPQECSCRCRNNPDCSTGFFFDEHVCQCQPEKANGVVFRRIPSSGSPGVESAPRLRSYDPYNVDDEAEAKEEGVLATSVPWYRRVLSRAGAIAEAAETGVRAAVERTRRAGHHQ